MTTKQPAIANKGRLNLAVVGAGVAGMVSARLLARRHSVTLFEAESRLGGHTNTVVLDSGPDAGVAVDTGFIVCNDRTYPLFHRFLAGLGVPLRSTDMSFGYRDERSGFCWAGTDLNGLFAQRRNLISPSFWGLLRDARRFHRAGKWTVEHGGAQDLSLGQWLEREGLRGAVVEHYIVPMGAAIWSAPYAQILAFPAGSYLRFFSNHGLLGITQRPQWQTVVGGSHSYVKAFQAAFAAAGGGVLSGVPVSGVTRSEDGVSVALAGGSEARFDGVVLAGHADQSLRLLADPDEDELSLLGAWRYQSNDTVLHTDASLLPPMKRGWASWNYLRPAGGEGPDVAVTYHMNRLQGLSASREYCVTLNLTQRIDPEKILRRFHYEHPVYTAEAVASQAGLPALNGRRRTWFAGSYFRHGFHEDAVHSANEVGKAFGETL